jgi:hypothetical protein
MMLGNFPLLKVWLVVGVLLTGVPAWQHAHAAGDQPHSHHGDHAHGHDGMGASHSHLHFWLFGMNFTMPVESGDSDSQDGESTFLVSAATVLEAAQPLGLACFSEPTCAFGTQATTEASFRSITASAAPLCDTARHERSGVLIV